VKELTVARSRFAIHLLVLAAGLAASSRALAVHPSESLLPATTKGFISTYNVDEVRKEFSKIQLGEMVHDPLMEPFIEDLKKQLGQKLERAGKKLGIKWEDLEGVYGGEVAAAMIQPDAKNKMSHATVLIVDITGKQKEAEKLLAKIDANQSANKAVRTTLKGGGVEMVVYTQPPKQGEKVQEKSFHFIKDDQLVLCDHEATAVAIAGRFAGKAQDTLASVKAFDSSMQRLTKENRDIRPHVRWFIEPFGYAEATRAAQGGKKKRGTDLLKILRTQGFTAAQGIGGNIFFATEDVEMVHRTFVYAPPVKRQPGDVRKDKYDLAMRMLDFPNGAQAADLAPPSWALPDIATYLTFNWKMKEAFNYSETLVDAMVGDKGAFKEIWKGMKTDENGPRIDIYKGLVDHLGTRATLLSDVSIPVGLRSERLLGLIEVTDPVIVAKTVEQAFKKDPQAIRREFRGQIIWEITQQEGIASEEPELMIEGSFVSGPKSSDDGTDKTKPAETEAEKEKKAQEKEDEKKLPNMAVTVYQGCLVVSTHLDFVKDLITHVEDKKAGLATMDDFQRVEAALEKLGSNKDSFNFFSRTDESYRATYELLKQGRLPEAETILARLLNALLGPEEEGAIRKPEIDGSKLPNFDLVKKYLGPGGLYVQSEDDGWWIVGCLLKKQ
jgi:hypothetical protein